MKENYKKILELLDNDNSKGIELLFDRLYKPLVLFSNEYLSHLDHSKDLVQDFFVDFWEKRLYKKTTPDKIENFIFVSVRNRCLNKIKSKDILNTYYSLEDVELAAKSYVSLREDLIARIKEEIDKLPDRTKAVVQCVLLSGMNYSEAADELGIAASSVKTLLINGKKHLSKVFAEDREMLLFVFMISSRA